MPTDPKAQAAPDELHVIIQTPDEIVWEGSAEAVSSRNSAGPFDILPEHANIITLIEREPITVTTPTGSREFKFEKAILSVLQNRVSVFADISSTDETESKNTDKPNK